MSADYSQSALLRFLKEAGMNGLINPATARSRRQAAESLLAQLDARESNDLRQLDLDHLCARIHKRDDCELRPEVIQLYHSRTAAALDDFVRWTDDPDHFVPNEGESRALRARRSQSSDRPEHELAREHIELSKTEQTSDLLPIPIRSDCVVYLQNLPFDLTADEAQRITDIVNALVRSKDQ